MGVPQQIISSYATTGGAGPATYKRSITIDHTKCGSGDSTDFPVLISGTYTYLKTTGNGGDVQSASGYDIFFTSDSAGSNLLSWEQVVWVDSTGVVEYWVKVPTVSSSVDTVIYLWYGNASTSSFQGGATGAAWNSNFKQVLHVPDGTTLSTSDSTSNAYDGTNSGCVVTTGKIDGGVYMNSRGDFVQNANGLNTMVGSSATHTESLWMNADDYTGGTNYFFDGDVANNLNSFANVGSATSLEWGYGGVSTYRTYTTSSRATGTWYLLHMVKTAAGNNGKLYVNGVEQATFVGSLGNLSSSTTTSNWGRYHASTTLAFLGKMDEMRVSSVALSADWILTEFNNQDSPSTFYTISSPL